MQAPLQPTKDFPEGGVAVTVTAVPEANLAEQALPQLRTRSVPVGVAVTVPELLCPADNVNETPVEVPPPPPPVLTIGAKFAVTLIASLTVTLQLRLVPEQAPLQLVKLLLLAGCAVSITALFIA